MERSQQPARRDMVYCHQCEDEWYRDEHGLTCPECHSDFTEIIEADHDPRDDDMHIPADTPEHYPHPHHHHHHHHHHHGDPYAPDPDEEDIENIGGGAGGAGNGTWTRSGPDGAHYHATFNRTFTLGGQGQQQGQQQGQSGGGLFGVIGSLLGAVGGGGADQQQQSPRPQSPNAASRASSAPGAPRSGTNVRHINGPGYSMTIASSSNLAGDLFPRNANAPQPFNAQPDNLQDMMTQMMMNIMGPQGPGMRGPGPMYPGGPFPGPGHHHAAGQMPFGNIFQFLGGGPGGQFGDAVFSQEALDRVITQLMEQHQTGNAPGPATAAAIKALPTRTLALSDLGESGKGECSICMDEVLPGATVTELPCHHWFHGDCIRAWLTEHDTCPHCRQGIMPKESSDPNRPRQPSQAPLHDMNTPEYARPQMPGAFAGATSNTAGNSSTGFDPRGSGNAGTGRQGSSSGNGSGMFSRMRDAFGGGGTPNNGDGGS